MRFGGNWTELRASRWTPQWRYTATIVMLTDTLKSKKQTSCYLGWLFSKILSDRYIGIKYTFGLLNCDRFIGDIVIPWIAKLGFCSVPFTVTLAGLKNVNRFIAIIVLCREEGGGGGVGAAGLNGITSAPRRILPRACRKKSEYGVTNNKTFFLISGKFNFCHFWCGLRKGRSAPPTSNLGDQTYLRLSLLSPTKEPQNSDAIAGYRHKRPASGILYLISDQTTSTVSDFPYPIET